VDLVEIGGGGVERIGLAQDKEKWRALGSVVKNLSSGYTTDGLLSSAQLHRVSYLDFLSGYSSYVTVSCEVKVGRKVKNQKKSKGKVNEPSEFEVTRNRISLKIVIRKVLSYPCA
jgi:hypothetical protein